MNQNHGTTVSMQPFSVMTRLWFPAMTGAVLLAFVLPVSAAAALIAMILALGLLLQARELGLHLREVLTRPANGATILISLSFALEFALRAREFRRLAGAS